MSPIPNIFGTISFSSESVAELVLFLVAAFTAVVSIVMFFHWKRYGMGGAALAFMEVLYIVVSIVFIIIAFLSLN